jgi:multiple sugar transport system substrate-binding protein
LTLLAMMAALTLTLVACGDDEVGSDADAQVSFMLFGDPEELANYRELISAYKEETGREVRLEAVPDREALLAKLTTAFSGGEPPDVFLINHRNMGGFAGRAIVPIGTALDTEDFYEIALDAFTVNDTLQCVPQNISSLVVYYNAERFREAGVPRPRPGWSYDEFLRAARALRDGPGHAVGLEPAVIRSAPFVWGEGGEIVDDTENPARFTFDTPEGRRGLERMAALEREGLAPNAEETEERGLDARFLDGELAMFFSSRREVPTFRTIEDFDWDVASFPTIGQPSTVLHSDGFCIARGGNVEAARRFVLFATGRVGEEILARGGRTVPSRRSVAESDAFLDPGARPRSSQVFLDAVESMKRLPTARNWTEVEDRANEALESYFFGRADLDETLERIASETDGQF